MQKEASRERFATLESELKAKVEKEGLGVVQFKVTTYTNPVYRMIERGAKTGPELAAGKIGLSEAATAQFVTFYNEFYSPVHMHVFGMPLEHCITRNWQPNTWDKSTQDPRTFEQKMADAAEGTAASIIAMVEDGKLENLPTIKAAVLYPLMVSDFTGWLSEAKDFNRDVMGRIRDWEADPKMKGIIDSLVRYHELKSAERD